MTIDIQQLAAQQLQDRDAGTPGTIFAESISITSEQAYAISSEVSQLRVARGEKIVGYKVGCTSPGIQQQLGIDAPVFGYLFESESWPSGTSFSERQFAKLAIEGELAVELATDLKAHATTLAELNTAVAAISPVIELHNFVFRGAQPSAPELIANNAIHAGYVYPTNSQAEQTLDVYPGTLRIEVDGQELATVASEQLTATVISSLRWLSQELERTGTGLKAGQTVLCGSVADLFPVHSNCRINVISEHLGTVDCTVNESTP
jgi:2-keto-4-pentenoate hydratase